MAAPAPARRPARSAEIPQGYFDFHKFGVIVAEAPDLSQFNFLHILPRGDTGFWMKTVKSKVLFVLTKTEMQDNRVYCWRFSSVGWTPLGRQVHVTIYNSGPIVAKQRMFGAVANDR